MDNFKACLDNKGYAISEQGVLFFYTKEDNIIEVSRSSSDFSSTVFNTANPVSDSKTFTTLKEELVKYSKQQET